MNHYTDFSSFSDAFVGFAQLVRKHKLNIGLDESRASVTIALQGIWHDREIFEYALASIFCNCPEDKSEFAVLFDRFWRSKGSRIQSKTTFKNQTNLQKRSRGTVVMMGQGNSDTKNLKDAATTTGANARESLKRTDFSHLSSIESQALDLLADKLIREMSLRIRRRTKPGRYGKVDLARSMRKSLQSGGELIELKRRKRKREKFRLNLILDVSGSMDKYSFYLLRFMWALRTHFKQVEAFVFSTQMMRITQFLSEQKLDEAMHVIGLHAQHWSGGTKIGECLKQFNKEHAISVLNGKSITIILSDGLDTGEPEILQKQLERIKLKTKKLIWLNPLKGMEGYRPIQKGMRAALPALDHFQSAHNFQSLLTLEDIIAHA